RSRAAIDSRPGNGRTASELPVAFASGRDCGKRFTQAQAIDRVRRTGGAKRYPSYHRTDAIDGYRFRSTRPTNSPRPKISLLHLRVLRQRRGSTGQHALADLQHGREIGDFEREFNRLLG